ncbi:hypothetical protein MPSEU_000122900 [Mayamaea pseudoterrestris]|nr:hypothetical protein MPSEU_000122900 [Mayamaea pseudoterrestris]
MNDEPLLTLKEFEREWRLAIALSGSSESSFIDDFAINRRGDPAGYDSSDASASDDPFDCSSLIIPPTHKLIDKAIQPYVQAWRELDERRILHADTATTTSADAAAAVDEADDDAADDDEADASSNVNRRPRKMTKTTKLPKWYTNRVRLPEQFDYASRQLHAPPDDGFSGDRVVSLTDASQTLSYETELWKLFQSVPTAPQLEARATRNVQLPHMQELSKQLSAAKPSPESLDALSQLRYSDRHDPIPQPTSDKTTTDTTSFVATIQLECWRRKLKRGASPDANRMSIELLGSQTLLDFHLAIVELTDDELWYKTLNDDENNQSADESGYFFVEGIFYTHGSVDYVTPIQTWLASGTKSQRRKRYEHLGLASFYNDQQHDLPVQKMAETRLQDVSMRLGYRYLHVCHGDVECSVFGVDRKLGLPATTPYPVLHDVWTPNYVLPDCEACRSCPATIATSTDCAATLGHAAVCEACSRQLQLQTQAPRDMERYTIWRSQGDLSSGASNEKYF